MHLNAKVALLLLGMLVGGVAGYLTKPHPVEIVRIGEQPGQGVGDAGPMPASPMLTRSPDPSGGIMVQDGGRILVFAAIGGAIGLLAGFAAGRL